MFLVRDLTGAERHPWGKKMIMEDQRRGEKEDEDRMKREKGDENGRSGTRGKEDQCIMKREKGDENGR